jgi:nitroreductase
MFEFERAGKRPGANQGRRRTNRRRFLRDTTLLSVTALAGAGLLGACRPEEEPTAPQAAVSAAPTTPPRPTPTAAPSAAPPPTSATTASAAADASSLMAAFRGRKSAAGFQSQPLPADLLLNLLWAAWGVNRPESGKRTAPSAMNRQEMDLYVLLAEGAFLYDAQENKLTPVVSGDLRSQAGGRGAMRDAPVQLVYVADYARMGGVSSAQQQLYSAAHCGFIGQNVYLFCAAARLGARFYASLDAPALKTSLKLRDDQGVLFGQAVGYAR